MANVKKVIEIALKEVGYLEKRSNKNLNSKTANAGSNNYTKYWNDLCKSLNGQSWCNCFVNWCFVKAYGMSVAKKLLCSQKGFSYYTPTSASYFKPNQWYTKNPKVGDIIYFKNSQRIHHVGLVYAVDSKYVYTVEGNTSAGNKVIPNGGGVAKKMYLLSNPNIAGYGRPTYNATKPSLPKATLKKGSKGDEVKKLQTALNYLLNTNLKVDGDFGENTEKVVKQFNEKYKISKSGIYDSKSETKMKTLIK